ncbi:zinc finger and BTB domain-containing protein 47-like [Acanthaster planci]|uniref:Zinc finger and BTB domain-containing protein 47-like n=1 Tax=Acanthaster planci TaxID=133434 RepID=A0A8B8A7Z5_ACAPL|nr:zinc finger and BTB domain-containing protein 47-like [Acanthaster planci]
MPTTCIAGGCSKTSKDGVSLHSFPADPTYRTIWEDKVKLTRPNWSGPSSSSKLCSDHFEPSCFESGLEYLFGISVKKRLKPEAIPTKFAPAGKEKTKPRNERRKPKGAFRKRKKFRILNEVLPKKQQISDEKTGQDDGTASVSRRCESRLCIEQKATQSLPSVHSESGVSGHDDEHVVPDECLRGLPRQFVQPSTSEEYQDSVTNYQQLPSNELSVPRSSAVPVKLEKAQDNSSVKTKSNEQSSSQSPVHSPSNTKPVVKAPINVVSKKGLLSTAAELCTAIQQQQPGSTGKTVYFLVDNAAPTLPSPPPVIYIRVVKQKLQGNVGSQQQVCEQKQLVFPGNPTDSILQSNPGLIKTGSVGQPVRVNVQQESCQESKNDVGNQPEAPEEKQETTQGGQSVPGPRSDLGWIKTEPGTEQELLNIKREYDSGVGFDFTCSREVVQREICLDGNKDENNVEVVVKQELFERAENENSGVGDQRAGDISNTCPQEGDQNSGRDENAEISEDDEDDDDDHLEMEDDSRDEDYVPEVKVHASRKKKWGGRVLRCRQTDQKASSELEQGQSDEVDGESKSSDGSEGSLCLSSDSGSDMISSDDDWDERERRERRVQKKKQGERHCMYVRLEVQLSRLPKVYECKSCQERFREADDMRTHYTTTHHQETSVDRVVSGPSISPEGDIYDIATELRHCSKCNNYFENIQKHRNSHKEKRFVCEMCGKRFAYKCILTSHKETHKARENRNLLHCTECDKSYYKKFQLMAHCREKHSKDTSNLFVCEKCGKQFKASKRLNIHRLIHLEDKPFKCPECGRGFSQKSNMTLHMRMHTGARPYQCKICQETFNHNVSLKNHQKKEHGIDW